MACCHYLLFNDGSLQLLCFRISQSCSSCLRFRNCCGCNRRLNTIFMFTQPFGGHGCLVNEDTIAPGEFTPNRTARNTNGCYPWMNRSSMGRAWSLRMALNLLAFILLSQRFNEPQPCQENTLCEGAAKTIHSRKQQALDPVDIYWRVPHTVLVTLLSMREWRMTQHHVIASTITLCLQMCMWRGNKGLCAGRDE